MSSSSSSSGQSLQSRLLAGAGGGFIAESITLPTDVIKVRLQLQQATSSAGASTAGGAPANGVYYNGMLDCGMKIAKAEGVAGLWKGYTPAILRQVSYSSLMMVLYEPVRNGLSKMSEYACPCTSGGGTTSAKNGAPQNSSSRNTSSTSGSSSSSSNATANTTARTGVQSSPPATAKPSFLFRLCAGGIAGGTSIAIFNPFEVAKTKIQGHLGGRLSIFSVFRDVYKVDGIPGFWSGVKPNVMRTFLVNAAELGTYDQAKTEYFVPYCGDGLAAHVGASGVAGFVSACVSTPVDVVKTRLMNSAGLATKQYSGVIDATVSIVKEEGLGALYKGFTPICVRKLIWVTAFFVSYERIRLLV
ncbi:unnamed protein product [Amoebophrya sp. A120]|nr:unnamed protein product [Amoebophrya sp. A120]|eukprot:GSA120T00012212001.1